MRTLLTAIAVSTALFTAGCSRYTFMPVSNKQPAPQEEPTYSLSKLAHRVHRRVNVVRKEYNHEPLTWADTLARLARSHSRAMAQQDFFAHENPNGEDATDRADAAGFSCRIQEGERVFTGVAENILYTSLSRPYKITRSEGREITRYMWKDSDELAREIVHQWMESPEHRRNLLNARHQIEGLGLARTDDDRIYVTQDFC